MSDSDKSISVEPVALQSVAEVLRQTEVFGSTDAAALGGIGPVERISVAAGTAISKPGDPVEHYWIVLEGQVEANRLEADGTRNCVGTSGPGQGFGETPLLSGKPRMTFEVVAASDATLLQFSSEQFWKLMACCPEGRKRILADMARRLQAYQVEALHREKLVSLGTLAAGLMHELHNPGSAAKRAASQLRENLMRVQEVSLRSSRKAKTAEQVDCMRGLLEHTMNGGCRLKAMSSVEQADAEEEMSAWLAGAGVDNAYVIGPVLVEMGFERQELECAKETFDAESFSDALNWLGSLVSSVSLVCAIEESITRISELAMAVKKFAYDEKAPARDLDVHDSLQSTLTILGHKLHIKQITVEKRFEADPAKIQTRGSALSQVWTNLIDNAADASPNGGRIEIATWVEPETDRLAVSITDHGEGIPAEVLPRIFDPFFTTKPQGSGTGLGLEIVQRIVTQKFGGTVDVVSEPGRTQFTVRLPLRSKPEMAARAKLN